LTPKIDMAALLDVNALIALVDRDHVGHDPIHRWFAAYAKKGWATCPITENGMVRVLSQPAYPSGQRSPAEAIQVLRALKAAYRQVHEFWADDVSLSDESIFDPAYITRAKQVTDAYLLGLAARRKQRVVSFDRSLPWQAIRNGSPQLIQLPE
jgi:toxin-antitoxin system PIN domain toxin